MKIQCIMTRMAFMLLITAAFSSCFGVAMKAAIHKNGSADMDLEYRINKELAAFGAVSENNAVSSAPLSKEDFQNSAAARPGVKLKSYSKKEDQENYIYKVKLRFDNVETLTAYLRSDYQQNVTYRQENGKHAMTFFYRPPAFSQEHKQGAFAVLGNMFKGYTFDFSITLPGPCEAAYKDGAGNTMPPPEGAHITDKNKTYAISMEMSRLFTEETPYTIVLTW